MFVKSAIQGIDGSPDQNIICMVVLSACFCHSFAGMYLIVISKPRPRPRPLGPRRQPRPRERVYSQYCILHSTLQSCGRGSEIVCMGPFAAWQSSIAFVSKSRPRLSGPRPWSRPRQRVHIQYCILHSTLQSRGRGRGSEIECMGPCAAWQCSMASSLVQMEHWQRLYSSSSMLPLHVIKPRPRQ